MRSSPIERGCIDQMEVSSAGVPQIIQVMDDHLSIETRVEIPTNCSQPLDACIGAFLTSRMLNMQGIMEATKEPIPPRQGSGPQKMG